MKDSEFEMGGCGTLMRDVIRTTPRKTPRAERTPTRRPAIPHLRIQECSINAGFEWTCPASGWCVVQARVGSGYWVGLPESLELPEGGALVLSARALGVVRASVLGGLVLRYFGVEPARLAGLFTLPELRFFEKVSEKEAFAARVFGPDSATAARLKQLEAPAIRSRCAERLQLIEAFIESFPDMIRAPTTEGPATLKARERLESFLRETPSADLLYVNLAELARLAGCTPRHLNRIFNELVGMSFREKHTELRLARACELLADTEAKVVDVALESGYQSLSLFNLMFARRFGMSPGRWRKNQRDGRRHRFVTGL